jgi:hypothetical protein
MKQVNPDTSITNYRHIIDQAKEVRHLPYVLPSYFRLSELLVRQGRVSEAIQVIEQFESRFKNKKQAPHYPTETQMGMMSIKNPDSRTQCDRPARVFAIVFWGHLDSVTMRPKDDGLLQ